MTKVYDEIVLDNREDADQVIDTMKSLIKRYGFVTVGDLYGLVEVPTKYSDQLHGWNNLDGEGLVCPMAGGFLLNLPRPIPRSNAPLEVTGYMVYHQSGDSYHSRPEMPKAIFLTEENAIEFAKKQGGYGYEKDWFVRPVPVHP